MNAFAIVSLAAAALLPAAAAAHPGKPAGPVAHGAMPPHVAAPPRVHAPLPHAGHPAAMGRRHHGQGHVEKRIMRRHHGVNGYRGYHRIERGFGLPHQWWGPQYHVRNWGMYGLPQPMHGGRWVRYYDDALLIDGQGRVHDGRWGMKWDDWQDQWGYDESGVPVYVGNGDFHPGEQDYAWVEQQGGAYAHGGQHGYAYPHHGYGYGYGYAYPHAGMVITETTVTTAPTVVTKTVWVEEEVRTVRKQRRHRAKPRCNCPKPAPVLPGERG